MISERDTLMKGEQSSKGVLVPHEQHWEGNQQYTIQGITGYIVLYQVCSFLPVAKNSTGMGMQGV